jgi:hypothetical protein
MNCIYHSTSYIWSSEEKLFLADSLCLTSYFFHTKLFKANEGK